MKLTGHDLACVRGGRTVFSGLDLEVAGGTLLALRGANGTGKSSLLRLIAGLIRPASGELALDAGDPERSIGEQAHYVGHLDALKPALSVRENLEFWRAFQGVGVIPVTDALERAGIGPLADFPAVILSAGQRRRLALARLLTTHRPIWLLDEPTTALDAQGRTLLVGLIEDHLGAGGLALVATHVELPGETASLELGRAR
jgi:heme exporter protein A